MTACQNPTPGYLRLLIQRKSIWQQPRISGKILHTCRTPNFKIYVKHDRHARSCAGIGLRGPCLYIKLPAPEISPSWEIPYCIIPPLDIEPNTNWLFGMFRDLEGFRDIRVMGRAWKTGVWSKQNNSVIQKEEHKHQGGIASEEATQERKDHRADHPRLEFKSKPWYSMISGLALEDMSKKCYSRGVHLKHAMVTILPYGSRLYPRQVSPIYGRVSHKTEFHRRLSHRSLSHRKLSCRRVSRS